MYEHEHPFSKFQAVLIAEREAAQRHADEVTALNAYYAAKAQEVKAAEKEQRERDRRGRAELVQILLDPEHQAQIVLARAKFGVPLLAKDAKLPAQVVWMPVGVHEISAGAMRGGSWSGVVKCDAVSAANVIRSFEALRAAGERIFFDFAHREGEAAAWVVAFSWDPSRGICATVQWTSAGEEAVRGGVFATFSPTFFVSDDGHVAGLVPGCAAGGLVNSPAFKAMPNLTAGARSQSAQMLRETLIATGIPIEIADHAATAVEAGADSSAVAAIVQTYAAR